MRSSRKRSQNKGLDSESSNRGGEQALGPGSLVRHNAMTNEGSSLGKKDSKGWVGLKDG